MISNYWLGPTRHQREGLSLDNQEAKIRSYVTMNDLLLLEVIRDEGASGKSLDRPGMARVLELAERGEIDAVIVYKLDRLSRKTLDTLNLIETLEKKGIAFHSISEKVDTKSATGKFFLTIVSAIAQMERDLISERTRDVLKHKKVKGEWTGRIPYGFKMENSRLVENVEQIRVIQKAKRMKRTGRSMRDIAEALDLSLGYVHKILNVNLRSLKSLYGNGIQA
jgi:site-specific DNA recombinase